MGRRGRQRDTELAALSDAEISRLAHDKSLSKQKRRRFQKEEKCRGLRNRSKQREY